MMTTTTQQRLLALNRAFYAAVADEFDRTRAGLPAGWAAVLKHIPQGSAGAPITVLDAGCGNGRFARALDGLGIPFCYAGLDVDAALLARAAQNTGELIHGTVRFVPADLAEPGWSNNIAAQPPAFDLIACFAMLHHLPGYTLRLQVVKELASLLAVGGRLVFSHWQFLTSARFVQKQIAWQTVGLADADVEPGDALLPWQQGGYAVRYVHQIDEEEMARLAHAAGLTVVETFYADGKEGNLNLYTVLVTAPA